MGIARTLLVAMISVCMPSGHRVIGHLANDFPSNDAVRNDDEPLSGKVWFESRCLHVDVPAGAAMLWSRLPLGGNH